MNKYKLKTGNYTVSALMWTGSNNEEFAKFADTLCSAIVQFDKKSVMIITLHGTNWISPNWYLVIDEFSNCSHIDIISKQEFEELYEPADEGYSESTFSKLFKIIYLQPWIEHYFPKKDV